MKKEKEFVILAESTLQSWARDLGTYVMALALILPGWFIQSSAMQWLGALVFFISVATHNHRRKMTFTLEGAIAHLQAMQDRDDGLK